MNPDSDNGAGVTIRHLEQLYVRVLKKRDSEEAVERDSEGAVICTQDSSFVRMTNRKNSADSDEGRLKAMTSPLAKHPITFYFCSAFEERDVIASYRNFSGRNLRCLLILQW